MPLGWDLEREQLPHPYEQPPRHNPAFPSWRYAGLPWLTERLYRNGRFSKG